MAGLLPRLQEGALPGSVDWVYLDRVVLERIRWKVLCGTFANALPEKSNVVIRQDLNDPEGAACIFLGNQVTRGTDQRLVLFVDPV